MFIPDVDRPSAQLSSQAKRTDILPCSLTCQHLDEALQHSKDAGVTLQLSRLGLTDVGHDMAEDLAAVGRRTADDECIIERLAFDHNRLTTLPTEFALLSRLRYLNLKHNSLVTFPDVLTLLPSLDTLDISYNKIKRFPQQPGNLTELRVLRLSRNRVTRLPSYLDQLHKLELLQLDRNPIEWPPRSVLDTSLNLEGQSMRDWIHTVQKWIQSHTSNNHLNGTEHHDWEQESQRRYKSWRFPIRDNDFDAGVTPHARTFSVDSNTSLSSIPESLQAVAISRDTHGPSDRPPPLHLGILQSRSTEVSPTHSFESYLPSPSNSNSFDVTVDIKSYEQKVTLAERDGLDTGEFDMISPNRSLPDLRTAQLNIVKKGKTPDPYEGVFVAKGGDEYAIPSPLSQRQDSGSSFASGPHAFNSSTNESLRISSPSTATPSMAFERNSYFHRLSSLPITISLPKPLACLIESARTILFVLCQVYTAIEHYAIHAIDERLSSVLRKVLDPANDDMIQLIRSLDRFDEVGRKMVPPPNVCRGLIESCRDTVAAFSKALGVLTLQLKVISASGDARFSRWVLLELYAATAELSCAWQTMLPHIDSMKPLLRAKSIPSQLSLVGQTNGDLSHSSSITSPGSTSYSTLRTRPLEPLIVGSATVSAGRIRTARRHAGSFSSKDVEIGKQLPSYDDILPALPAGIVSGVASHIPTPRTPKRQATSPPTTAPFAIAVSPSKPALLASTSMSSIREASHSNHSRHASGGSIFAPSLTSSPSLPSKVLNLELPSTSKTQVDKEALQALQRAIEVAPIVWEMTEETFSDALDADIREGLEKAKTVTKRIAEAIWSMHDGNGTVDRKGLREDAHSFLKTVVRFSNFMKTHGETHAVSSTLRSNMIKLTNSTEEFAMLLPVASLSPSTPRSFSPMLHLPTSHTAMDDNRLGSNLSRVARSAQPSPDFHQVSLMDGPRSALPTQSFKLPTIRRLRSAREGRVRTAERG
ncbi:RAM signaling pathway protein-domain-containing protein [Crucibulum laeve]|uniref:RAM signaling pathway protein-domain-containing protein n=1 Tax=Crucibulum laeve TaxID=68775 RepID=A0A5C3MBA3_9AGAR|nr:RAM signaling pathway protein-domain-containing protein [Crucibulum laeve]